MKVKGTMDDQELSKLLSEYLPSDDTPDSDVAAAKEYAGKDVTDSVLDRNPSSVEDFAEEIISEKKTNPEDNKIIFENEEAREEKVPEEKNPVVEEQGLDFDGFTTLMGFAKPESAETEAVESFMYGTGEESKSAERQVERDREERTQEDSGLDTESGFFHRNWSWLFASALVFVFMLVFMIAGQIGPFGSNSLTLIDSMHQYVPFFSDFQDKLKTGGSLFYTWDVGGGQNFQSLMLYYIASPINFILVFFSRKAIPGVMSAIIVGKLIFSAGSFGYYLSRRNKKIVNSPMITAFSVAFALNNYMAGYFWNIMWLDCIMVFPLIMLGYKRLMRDSDPRMYTLALFYSLFCNYYISFMICIFLVLWFFCTGHKNVKKFFTDGLKFAACSLLAAGMAAFSLLMAYLAIMKTASAGKGLPEQAWYQNIFLLLKQQLFLSQPINNDNFDGNANLYCGTLTFMLFFIYLVSSKISFIEKVRKTILIAILILSMNSTVLNFIWHGFHDQYGIPNRFSFLYIFVLLEIGFDTLGHLRKTGGLLLLAGLCLSSAFLVLTAGYADLSGYLGHVPTLLITVALMVTFAGILLMIATKNMQKKTGSILLASLFILEIFVNAGIGFGMNGVADAGYYLGNTESIQNAVSFANQEERGLDNSFARADMVNPRMLDEATFSNMKSLGTFCSTVRGDMVSAMAKFGYYTGANEYLYSGASPASDDIMGVRYIYTCDGDYYPKKYMYSKIYDREGVQIYENEDALPIAYAANDTLLDWDVEAYHAADNLNKYVRMSADMEPVFVDEYPSLTTDGKDCSSWIGDEDKHVISYRASGNTPPILNIYFTVKGSGDYFVNLRGNGIENVTYSLNGQQITSDRYQLQLFDLGNLADGDEVMLSLKFASYYSPSGTISVDVSRTIPENLQVYTQKMAQGGLVVSKWTDNSLTGSVNIGSNQFLMTTIPYDEGWSVWVDGQKMETEKVVGAFLGVELPEGQHEVVMKFMPQGFWPGLLASAFSFLIFIMTWVIYCRHKREKEA